MRMFDLNGGPALITGAGQGIGYGIAKALANNGTSIFINGLYAGRAMKAASKISATALPGDITAP